MSGSPDRDAGLTEASVSRPEFAGDLGTSGVHAMLFPMGSSGDVHPLIGLGLSLKQRGHRITICTSGYFKELIERVGLDYLELGTKEQFLRLANHQICGIPFAVFPTYFATVLIW